MSKGKALLEARKLFGPTGHVRVTNGTFGRSVGTFDENGYVERGFGLHMWSLALADAKERKEEAK